MEAGGPLRKDRRRQRSSEERDVELAPEKRRISRIPIACTVVVREKLAIWNTTTEDVGARGCRIALKRALSPGALVQLRFDTGPDEGCLEVVGQAVWARRSESPAAGIAFVGQPADRSGVRRRTWIDVLVANQLRGVLESSWTSGGLAKLGNISLHLGTPPDQLDPSELAVIRLAREGAPLSAMCYTTAGLQAVTALLDRGAVTVYRTNPDPEGWKRAIGLFADDVRSRERAARDARAVIITPPPDPAGRSENLERVLQEYLQVG
jgi:hypothetical protein